MKCKLLAYPDYLLLLIHHLTFSKRFFPKDSASAIPFFRKFRYLSTSFWNLSKVISKFYVML
jgi:hypothetical protein